jgi:peptidoglycan hydrolase-like protein with peptidoglycan-binding domain
VVNGFFAKRSKRCRRGKLRLIIRKGNWRYLALVKQKPEEAETDDMPDDPLRVGPSGVIASVLIALMSSAILYNLIWRQHALAPAAGGGERTYVEIVAGEDGEGKLGQGALKRNSERSALISAVQEELSGLALFDGPIDGVAGDKTRAAVLAYQRKHRLAPSGKADRKLLEHLRFTRTLLQASEYTGTVAPLSADEKVARVQKGLAALGYRPGAFDGFLGEQTREAIRQFERDRNWPVTGELSDLLMAELSDIGAFAEADAP